tara:strand:- start:10302 stop:10406 length:105 start_codon:yes stop_codon:yes gene_type:complete
MKIGERFNVFRAALQEAASNQTKLVFQALKKGIL